LKIFLQSEQFIECESQVMACLMETWWKNEKKYCEKNHCVSSRTDFLQKTLQKCEKVRVRERERLRER